ncbi:right-handed parallel beta-helix repeat-containing protein, partial [Halomarina rubra]
GIQDAYERLPSGGGIITLSAGRYVGSPGHQYPDSFIKIHDPDKPVALVGQGYATEIFIPDNYQDNDGDGNRVIDIGGVAVDDPWLSEDTFVDGCLFKDFRINGNQQNNNGDGDGNTITNANDGHNIECFGSDNKFVNLWSNNSTGDGIEISRYPGSVETDTEANLIHGCTFRDNWEQNVHIHGGTHTKLSDSWLLGEVNNSCLHLAGGTETTKASIDGCFIYGSDVEGAVLATSDVAGGGPDATEIQFTNNYVWGHGRAGVLVDGRHASGITIDNCHIFENGQHGIYAQFGADKLTIRDCEIHDNQWDGVTLSAGVDGNGDGGALTNVRTSGNDIYNNNQEDSNYRWGINVVFKGYGAQNLHIEGDHCFTESGNPNYREGIKLQEQTAGGTYRNIVVENCHASGTMNGAVGIQGGVKVYRMADNTPRQPVDVTTVLEATDGAEAYNDGTVGRYGPAFYDG